jgi:curved DNA-binding protein CbpA
MADHYSTLGVARFADPLTIRSAYRALARRSHPDAGGDAQTMVRLNSAWDVLSQPSRRASYDEELRNWERATAERAPTPRQARNGHTILDFGRYEGWSLLDIGAVDDDYLVWLARTPTGRSLRAEIARILEDRARALEAVRPAAVPTKRRGWRG